MQLQFFKDEKLGFLRIERGLDSCMWHPMQVPVKREDMVDCELDSPVCEYRCFVRFFCDDSSVHAHIERIFLDLL